MALPDHDRRRDHAPMRNSTVADVMTTTVRTARPAMPIKDVARVLARHGLSALPVLDADDRVVGMVSERDLLSKQARPVSDPARWWQRRRARAEIRRARGDTAGDVMTAPALTIGPTAVLAEAAALMIRHEVKHLPVLDDDGRLVGVVSRGDLVRRYLRSDDALRRAVVEEVFVHIMLTDARAVRVSVEQGVVTLAGQMQRRSEAEIAERLVRRMDGVVDVTNQLTHSVDDGGVNDLPLIQHRR
jgi:CBS domain-containing protein